MGYIIFGLVVFAVVFVFFVADMITFGRNTPKPKEKVKHLYTGASALMLPSGNICWTSGKGWLSEDLRQQYCQYSEEKNCLARGPIG